MEIEKTLEGSKLIIAVKGRIDTLTATELQTAIDSGDGINELVLDFDCVDYISSAGLRVLLTNQKKMMGLGRMSILNVSSGIDSLFHLTGFSSILTYELKPRELFLDGCELIGAGITGECYRVDDETILKLYFENIPDAVVKSEKALSKVAFIAGLPTAISFDIVTVEQRRGVLYEMLKADTMSKYIIRDANHLEDHVKRFVELCKTIHSTKGDPAVFPEANLKIASCVDQCDFLTDAQKHAIKRRTESLPCDGTLIHGDLHTSNIMMQGDEPCLIDMGDMAIGSPVLDLGQIYHVYHCLKPEILLRAVGMEPEMAEKIWQMFFNCYYEDVSDEKRESLLKDIQFARCLKLMVFFAMNIGPRMDRKNTILESLPPEILSM